MSEKTLIGFILWDNKRNRPWAGTRRFKVWSTKSEAGDQDDWLQKMAAAGYDLEVKEAYV